MVMITRFQFKKFIHKTRFFMQILYKTYYFLILYKARKWLIENHFYVILSFIWPSRNASVTSQILWR